MKSIFSALLSLLFLIAPSAHAQFVFSTNNGTLTAEQYIGTEQDVAIPSNVGGLPVVAIDNGCFSFQTNVVEVSIQDGVQNIAGGAFGRCSGLASVVIPGSVTNIGDFGFYKCSSLTNLQIAYGLRSIGVSAFSECDALANLVIPASVTNFDYAAFQYCTVLTNVILQNGAPGIPGEGENLFRYCPNLQSVMIFGSNASVGEAAFQYCSGLIDVTIGEGVVNIGVQAFQYCSNLPSIYLPNSVTNIGAEAFATCLNLTNVILPSGIADLDGVFPGCSNLFQIIIPAAVTNIGVDTFAECVGLRSVFFKGNAPAAEEYAFDSDTRATAYYLPSATGWGSNFAGLPTVLWNPQIQTGTSSFGMSSNNFGFTLIGASNLPVAVEATSDLSGSNWTVIEKITLTNGLGIFRDTLAPMGANRFYRLAFP